LTCAGTRAEDSEGRYAASAAQPCSAHTACAALHTGGPYRRGGGLQYADARRQPAKEADGGPHGAQGRDQTPPCADESVPRAFAQDGLARELSRAREHFHVTRALHHQAPALQAVRCEVVGTVGSEHLAQVHHGDARAPRGDEERRHGKVRKVGRHPFAPEARLTIHDHERHAAWSYPLIR